MCNFRENIAMRCGVNAALIAEHLWYLLNNDPTEDFICFRHERFWVRSAQVMMTGVYPFMSIHMVHDAVKVLIDKGLLSKRCLNDNRFDHTNWYSFTDYGERLMGEGSLLC